MAIAAPPLTAPVAFAVDLTTGAELMNLNADTPALPASTMKIVTALVARELLALDTSVQIEQRDLLDPTVYSTMGLQAGDVVSVRDLLYGLLIPSGGDAANALARAGGLQLGASDDVAVARFMEELNAFAVRIGMTSSRFANPTGADDPNTATTARDLARAAARLIDDQVLYQIVGMPSATVRVGGPNGRDLPLTNTNQLLAQDDVFGVKTGSEEGAGQCLIAGFWRGDNRILTVVLGSQDRYADTAAVMNAVDATWRWQALGQGARSLGASDELAAQGLTFLIRRTVLMTREQADALTYTIRLDPAATGRRRGVVVFVLGEREVARLPVYSIVSPG